MYVLSAANINTNISVLHIDVVALDHLVGLSRHIETLYLSPCRRLFLGGNTCM